MRISAAVIAVVMVAVLPSSAALRTAPAPPLRLLFIGNSLTATNDIPGIVEALSAAGGERVVCRTVAFGGYSLEDHWNRGDARKAIAEGGWSVVVLQQGPSALPESRVLLVEYARRFAGEAKRVGARTALYMVWPSADRRADFEGVKTSYAAAARAVSGVFLPAGEAWRTAWRRDAGLGLYGADGFHPTAAGSYLAALVIFQALSGRSPIGLPSTLTTAGGTTIQVTPTIAGLLQQAAAETNARQLPVVKGEHQEAAHGVH